MLARIEGWEGPDAVSVEDFETNVNGLSIHPSPASSSLEIEITDTPESDFSIEIIGITGQVLISKVYKTGVLKSSKFSIDISDLNDGIYFVKLSTPRNTIMDKFIKIE